MRRVLVSAAIGALMLGALAGAQQSPTTTTLAPEEKGPPKQEVVSGGTLPDDLMGRWLIVGWINMKEDDQAKTTTALWEITKEDAQLVFRENYRELPKSVADAVTAANAGDKAWRPTPQDLAAIAAEWDKTPERDAGLATMRNELYAQDAFDRDFQNEVQTRTSVWAARQTGFFRRSASPAVRAINVFGATEKKDGGWYGNYTTATIAAAPFPIPIKLEGKFQAYRVGDAPAPKPKGFFESLFSGCARQ